MPTKIAQITDPHLLAPGEELMSLDVAGRLQRVLDHAYTFDPDAYFITGDCCARNPEQETYHQLRPLLDALGKPYYLTPGNHDDRAMLRNAFFLEGHGQDAVKGLVRVGEQHFLFLDSSRGVVDDDQVNWLAKALKQYPDADIVLHHPPVPAGVPFMDRKYPLRETDNLLRVLTYDGRHRRVFCGHYHTGRTIAYRNLHVHICPPTSFFLAPDNAEFERQELPPAYLQLCWSATGFRAAPIYLP
ncbi:MAG: metallophosphoesterase [Bacteroidota bacterium]